MGHFYSYVQLPQGINRYQRSLPLAYQYPTTISLIVSENLGYIQADHIGNGWKWDMIYYCNQQNRGQSTSLNDPYVLGWNMVKNLHVSW